MKKYFAELIGTFILTFAACGAASFTGGFSGYLGVVGISLIFGFVYIAMAYSIGNISGAHLNPAVSLGFFISGRMNVIDLIGYVIAQICGGILGAAAILGITKTFSTDMLAQYSSYGYDLTNLGVNGYGEKSAFLQISMWGALIIEIILSFIFVISFIGVTAKKKYHSIAGVVIGLSLSAVHLFGIVLTGTSVNPARSFGPALVKALNGDPSALQQVWVFIVGPLVGGLLAAAVYFILTYEKDDMNVSKGIETEETNTEEQDAAKERIVDGESSTMQEQEPVMMNPPEQE